MEIAWLRGSRKSSVRRLQWTSSEQVDGVLTVGEVYELAAGGEIIST